MFTSGKITVIELNEGPNRTQAQKTNMQENPNWSAQSLSNQSEYTINSDPVACFLSEITIKDAIVCKSIVE